MMWVTCTVVVELLVPLSCYARLDLKPPWMVGEDIDRCLGAENEESFQYLLATGENNAVLIVRVILANDNSLEVEVVDGMVEVLMYLGQVVILDLWDCDEMMAVLVV